MHRLPDGSGFFVAEIGRREPGFWNWVKYRESGTARIGVYFWRTVWSTRELSRDPHVPGLPMSTGACIRYAWMICRQLSKGGK